MNEKMSFFQTDILKKKRKQPNQTKRNKFTKYNGLVIDYDVNGNNLSQ